MEEWNSSLSFHAGQFTAKEIVHITHQTGGLVCPRVSFDVLENTKVYYPCHAHICMVTVVLLDTTWQSGHILIQLFLYNDLGFEDVSPAVSRDSLYPYSIARI
jgi:hypothetical protein